MKRKMIITTITIALASFLLFAFIPVQDDQEKKEIRKAIEDYFIKGKIESSKELLQQIIHEDWRLHNVRNGKLVKYVRKDFFSWLRGDNSGAKFQIEYIDVTGNVAAAKTREDSTRMIWVDYFNLVKLDGKWWIIDKVAHPIRK